MKISKLFHWLYAILMLLPFAFFVPSILYYAFNDNSTMQSVEVPKTETISVDFNQYSQTQDFENEQIDTRNQFNYWIQIYNNETYVGTAYTYNNLTSTGVFYSRFVSGFNGNNLRQKANGVTQDVVFNRSYLPIISGHTYLFSNNFLSVDTSVVGGFQVANIMVFDLTQMYGLGNEPTNEEFINQFPNTYYPYTQSELMQITYYTGETEQLVENTSIINYAWESIWDLPLFSWTKVSFVAVPMTFLTGMFGLAVSNSLNYVFAYFVSISIIYLLFDVIMYFPLMVHRWIDKARLE